MSIAQDTNSGKLPNREM